MSVFFEESVFFVGLVFNIGRYDCDECFVD